MNRPPMRPSYEPAAPRPPEPVAAAAPASHSGYPGAYESSPGGSGHPRDGLRVDYDQLPSIQGALPSRASHLHLPAVSTYIEHYHYYNFNGNCTVQQAPSDGQPNTIHMSGGPTQQGAPHRSGHRSEIPPVPPPMREPLSGRRNGATAYHHAYPAEHPGPEQENYRSAPGSAGYGTLSGTHLPSLQGPGRGGIGAPGSLSRQPSFLPTARLRKPPTSAPDPRVLHGTKPSTLSQLRGASESDGPISLAPLQASGLSAIPPMRTEEGKMGSMRPMKRSRLSRSMSIPMSGHEIGRGPAGLMPVAGGDSNCASRSEEHKVQLGRAGAARAYGSERMVEATNSSSPSTEYPARDVRGDGYERGGGVGGGGVVARRGCGMEESQSNDWETVVEMYTTGKGTEDGVALKMITKGDGRRVSDRKLLEKRRTIGKTYECLGADRFEAAIGYKWENGVKRKQKMYHVISRCRVVNAMRKAGEQVPMDFAKLTDLIDERIAEKEALKEAGKNVGGRAGSGAHGGDARRGGRPSLEGREVQNSSLEGGESGMEGGSGGGPGGSAVRRLSVGSARLTDEIERGSGDHERYE